jgi:purine-cytosine permease-like protein
VALDTCICLVITFIAIFSNRFATLLEDFLLFVLTFFAPFAAIYIVDWALRRGRYDSDSLENTRGGLYWRRGGVHVPGLIALALGMFAAFMWLNTSVYVGPIASRIGPSDLSWLVGGVVGGLVYLVLARRSVEAEADASKEPLSDAKALAQTPGPV